MPNLVTLLINSEKTFGRKSNLLPGGMDLDKTHMRISSSPHGEGILLWVFEKDVPFVDKLRHKSVVCGSFVLRFRSGSTGLGINSYPGS